MLTISSTVSFDIASTTAPTANGLLTMTLFSVASVDQIAR
jgi:hypothetical protein